MGFPWIAAICNIAIAKLNVDGEEWKYTLRNLALFWVKEMPSFKYFDAFNENMSNLQVSARMKIREGMLEGFKGLATECVQRVKQKDPGTIQYDWFISLDKTECEIRETYENSQAFLAHLSNLSDLLKTLYENFAFEHSVVIYGDTSPELLEKVKARGVDTKFFSLLQGL